jgi:hypothetical protein
VVARSVLVLAKDPERRAVWTAELEAAGWDVVARASLHAARLALWEHAVAAVVAETPPEDQLADLLDAAPGPWPPPIVLVGAPHGEGIGVPRVYAAILCLTPPPPEMLPGLVGALVATAALATPAPPLGRTDFHLRIPAERVAKWKSWLA